jgi:hypothetical protein
MYLGCEIRNTNSRYITIDPKHPRSKYYISISEKNSSALPIHLLVVIWIDP